MVRTRVLATTWLSLAAICVAPGLAAAQMPLWLPGQRTNPVYSTEVRDRVPYWLELPRVARISTGDGLLMRPLHNSAISFENLKLGILVGALRNHGACATDLSVRLQYVDKNWAPMGQPLYNEARVSRVEPGGILPFRFRLRTIADSKVPPSAYVIVIEQDDKPMANPFKWDRWVSSAAESSIDRSPCPAGDTRLVAEVTRRQPLREGFLLEGTTTLAEGGPVRADGIVLTAVLRDAQHEVLEVLVGTPRIRNRDMPDGVLTAGRPVDFRLHTDMPLGKDVAHVDVMVELLPDARVAGTDRPKPDVP